MVNTDVVLQCSMIAVMVVVLVEAFPGIVQHTDDLLSQIPSGLGACYV